MKAITKLFALFLLFALGGVAGYLVHDRVPAIEIREVDSEGEDEPGKLVFETGPSDAELLGQVLERLDRLERQLRDETVSETRPDEVYLAETMARIDTLDDRIAEVEVEQDLAAEEAAPVMIPSPRGPTPEKVREWQDVLVQAESDGDRLRALRSLRGVDKKLNPHSPVITSIISWLDNAEDPDVREDIIRQLHGAEVDDLVEPLIHYLLKDPSAGVREEAAETLSDYYELPAVTNALKLAIENDESRKVRREAAQSLHGGERKGDDDDDDEKRKRHEW